MEFFQYSFIQYSTIKVTKLFPWQRSMTCRLFCYLCTKIFITKSKSFIHQKYFHTRIISLFFHSFMPQLLHSNCFSSLRIRLWLDIILWLNHSWLRLSQLCLIDFIFHSFKWKKKKIFQQCQSAKVLACKLS